MCMCVSDTEQLETDNNEDFYELSPASLGKAISTLRLSLLP